MPVEERFLELLRATLEARSGSSSGDGDDDVDSEPRGGGGDRECGDSVGKMLQFDQNAALARAALGVMGYQAPEVCDTMCKHLMDTLDSVVLHSNMSAPILRSIVADFDIISTKLSRAHILELVELLLKAAVYMNKIPPKCSSVPFVFVRNKCGGKHTGSDVAWAMERILNYVSGNKESVYNRLSSVARLHAWRLCPSLLKLDLSDLAFHAMQHPLLSLKLELHSVPTYGIFVGSLALAPDLLYECQGLLFKWSLSVRAVRLMELRTELSFAVKDVLEHPVVTSSLALNGGVDWSSTHLLHHKDRHSILQVLRSYPTAASLCQLVEILERHEVCPRQLDVKNNKPSTSRKRKTFEISGNCGQQEKNVKDSIYSARRIIGFAEAGEEEAFLRSKVDDIIPKQSNGSVHCTTSPGGNESFDQHSTWSLLTESLEWPTLALKLLFQTPDPTICQTAATYLGWLLCPTSQSRRALITTELVQVTERWHFMCREGMNVQKPKIMNHGPGGNKPPNGYQGETQGHAWLLRSCKLCGSAISWIDSGFCGPQKHISSCSIPQCLETWLIRLCCLGGDQQELQPKEKEGKQQVFAQGLLRILRVFPITSLASDSTFLSSESGALLLSMVLLGFSWPFEEKSNEGEPWSPDAVTTCCTSCDEFHCMSCCPKDRQKSCEPAHCTEQIKDDAGFKLDPLEWVPFAVALFGILGTSVYVSMRPLAKGKSYLNQEPRSKNWLTRLVATCVQHWAHLTVQFYLKSSLQVNAQLHRHIKMLQDLLIRFKAWTEEKKPNSPAEDEVSEAMEELEVQITRLKTFL